MAIGAHELLLIVRAQNQASALLGRVGRDFRRLQNQRNLEMQRSQVINRMAKNALTMQQQIGKIQSVASKNGKIRLQHEQAIDRILLHQTNIRNRIANLDIRREAIARAESNLEVKRIRILQQELGIESQLEKIELRRAGIMNQVGRIGTTQLRNQQQVDTLRRTAHALETQEIQREMQVRKAESARMRGVSKKVSGRSMQNLMDAELIARRRLTETQMARAELPGQGRILASVGDDLKRNIVQTKGQLGELRIAEQKAELASQALAETVRGLEHQLAGLQARSAAVAGTEVELNKAIELTARDLQIANVEWAKQVKVAEQAAIALGHNIETQKMYNQQLMEFNALSAAQSGEKIATVARTASHIGRVLTATGLIGVAAFGAMAIAAAKFNSQAVNVATQTGNINQSAQAVVNNAAKIQTAVLKTMQTVPASSTDLTDALYNIYSSMQVTFGGGTKLLKLFGDVWVAGGMRGSIQDVSDALITLANNWQISGDNMKGFQKLAASTLATVRFGRLTVDQYTQTMNQLAPAFHGAHQSIEQMNGALAFLSRLLPSTGVTAAGIARMMEQFQRFAANPKAGFENLAKEITDTSGNLKPLNEVLQILINRMPDLAKSGVTLTNFFKTVSGNQGTVQARRALQGFILQFPEYQRVLKATTADQKELERSRKAMQESPGVKWATFMTQMHALALELGASVIPMLLAAIKPIQYIARGFDNLSDAQKRNIGHWAAWIAIGTLAAGVIASIAGGFALFIISMKTLKGAIGGGAGLKALGVEAGFVSARMGILGAALTALTLLFVQNPGLVKRMTDALGGLHTILKVLSALATVWTIQTIINSFLMMGNQAKIARGEIAATRVALLGLNGLTVGVIIAVSILQTPQYKKFRKWISDHGGPEANALFSSLPEVAKHVGGVAKQANMLTFGWAAESRRRDKAALRASIDVPNLFRLASAGAMSMADLNIYKDIIDPKDFAALKHHLGLVLHPIQPKTGTGFVAREGYRPSQAPRSWATQFDSAQYAAALRKAYKLQQNLNNASSPEEAYKAWQIYDAYVAKATLNMTAKQKKAWSEIFGMMDQFGAGIATHTQAQITAMVGNIRKMNKELAKHPSIALSAKISAAEKALTKAQYGDQQTIAENYYAAKDALEKTSTKTVESEAKKRKKLIDEEYKKQLKRQQDAQSTMKSVMSNLMQISQTAFQQYQSDLGTIFQGPWMTGSIMGRRQQFGFSARPKDLLTDMRMSVQHAEKFQGSLSKLRKRGAPDELVSQIRQLGPEAQKQLDVLLQQSPAMFAKYVKWFKRGQHDAHVAAMAELKSELKKWRSHGRAVALAIAAGMRDEDVALQMAMKKMIAKLFPGTHMLATTKPTRAGAAAAVDSRGGASGKGKGNYVVHDNRVTYNIHPSHKGESLQHMLRRTHFFYRNRK